MVEKGDAHLQRMGLTKLGEKDTFVEHDDEWRERSFLQEKIKESNLVEKIPKGNLFEISETPEDKIYVPCHLPIQIMVIKGDYCQKENSDIQNLFTAEEQHDWAMEETAEWCKEYLTSDEIKHQDKISALNHASEPETYSVPNYYEYIPENVKKAEDKYKTKYVQKNIDEHDWLKTEHVKITYRVLKCNFPLSSDQKIQQHYRKVHLLSNGSFSLKRREIIKVNTDLEFKITDLKQFEDLSVIRQNALFDKIYTHVVTTGIFEESSSRNEARINKSRSTEFINEMQKACLENFFERFK